MPHPRSLLATLAAATLAAAGAGCGSSSNSDQGGSRPAAQAPPAHVAVDAANVDWPTFDLTPQRTGALDAPTGITAANARRLQRRTVRLPGTVDSAPIYLHGVTVQGAVRDVFVVTTTYGRTVAVDAASGRVLWTFTPAGYRRVAGTVQITNASPTADSDRAHVFAASPDGLVHRLVLATGREERAGAWPVRVTRLPFREKLTSSLNLAGERVVVTTGGYIGDKGAYQGHVVTLDRRSGRVLGVFNSLCSDRRFIMRPTTCPHRMSAIWSRSGATVEPDGKLLVASSNGLFDGRRNWGDSVLELSPDARRLLQNWTPRNQAQLDVQDADLGSTGPVLLGQGVVLQSGKDGTMRVLSLKRLNGTGRPGPRLGGELQVLPAPGGGAMFTAPAVWRHGGTTTVFATTVAGTGAYAVRGGRLHRVWSDGTPGTSPIVAGGLLYVYDPSSGALVVRRPGSGRIVARLPAGGGHWNSPVIGGGRIALPQGGYASHSTTGVLNLYVLPSR